MNRNGRAPHAPAEALQGTEGLPHRPEGSLHSPEGLLHSPVALPQTPDGSPQMPGGSRKTPVASMQVPVNALPTPGASTQPKQVSRRLGRASYQTESSMARRLLAAQAAINGALGDATLLNALAAHGYGEAALKEGQDLIARARELYVVRRDRAGDRVAATRASEAALANARAVYMVHVGTARVALRDDAAAAAKLDIGRRERHRAGWLLQAHQFYLNALRNADIVGTLARYGVTEQQLAEGQGLIEAVLACHNTQQDSKAAAREAVATRDLAFQSLDRWMRDFLAIARIALANQPGALERLGIS